MKSIFQKIVLASLCVSNLQGASADGSGAKRFNYDRCFFDQAKQCMVGVFIAENYSKPVKIHGMSLAMITLAEQGRLHVMFDPAYPTSQKLSSDYADVQAVIDKHPNVLQDHPAPIS